MPAIWSLIVLIGFRATGVSTNRRRFAGEGFGYASGLGPYVFRMEGKGTVRRLLSTPLAPSDTSAIRRNAPRDFDVMFMMFCSAGVSPAFNQENVGLDHRRTCRGQALSPVTLSGLFSLPLQFPASLRPLRRGCCLLPLHLRRTVFRRRRDQEHHPQLPLTTT